MLITGSELKERISQWAEGIDEDKIYEEGDLGCQFFRVVRNPHRIDDTIEERDLIPYMIGKNQNGQFRRVDSRSLNWEELYWEEGEVDSLEISEDEFFDNVDDEEHSFPADEEVKEMHNSSHIKFVYSVYETPIVGSRKINDGKSYLLDEIIYTVYDFENYHKPFKQVRHLKVVRDLDQ